RQAVERARRLGASGSEQQSAHAALLDQPVQADPLMREPWVPLRSEDVAHQVAPISIDPITRRMPPIPTVPGAFGTVCDFILTAVPIMIERPRIANANPSPVNMPNQFTCPPTGSLLPTLWFHCTTSLPHGRRTSSHLATISRISCGKSMNPSTPMYG